MRQMVLCSDHLHAEHGVRAVTAHVSSILRLETVRRNVNQASCALVTSDGLPISPVVSSISEGEA